MDQFFYTNLSQLSTEIQRTLILQFCMEFRYGISVWTVAKLGMYTE